MMIHATEGTILQVFPVETGNLKNGKPFRKYNFIFQEYKGVKMCVQVFNECKQERMIKPDQKVYLEFWAESREYNGKWYTDIKCSGVRPIKKFTEHVSNHADWM